MNTVAFPVHSAAEIESSLTKLASEPDSGLIVIPDTFTQVYRELITSLALHHRLPAAYPYRAMAAIGGIVSYGVDDVELLGRAVGYVDRILLGEKPSVFWYSGQPNSS